MKNPMTDVTVGLNVSHEDFALAHGILSVLSHIDWCLDGASELELVGLNGDNANEWHLNDQLLGVLIIKTVFLDAPTSAFQEKTLDVGSRIKTFGDL